MRIAIDARPILKKAKTGIGIYTHNIINAISEIDKEDQFFLYSKLRPFDRKKKVPGKLGTFPIFLEKGARVTLINK